MFGNKSEPSVVFAYGCRLEEGAEAVWRQSRLAHRYRNRLVELERERREIRDAFLLERSAELHAVEADLERDAAELAVLNKQVKEERAQKRTRAPATRELRERVKSLRARIRTLGAERSRLRKALFADEQLKVHLDRLMAEHRDRQREARNVIRKEGLFWCNYLVVEQSMGSGQSKKKKQSKQQSQNKKSKPQVFLPNFKAWKGHARISVQCQKGVTPERAFSGKDTRVRITPLDSSGRTGRRAGREHRIAIRVGSQKGRPLWATVRAEMHRPLPADCKIKWVYLVGWRVGTHVNWQVQFVLSRKTGWAKPDCATSGTVAVNLGWRKRSQNTMRAAYWLGDDGEEAEVLLDERLVAVVDRTKTLQSIRDLNFNRAILQFRTWKDSQESLPDWLAEATTHVHQWKAQARLASLVIRWRRQRFEGDESIFTELAAWQKQDRHLLEWQANESDTAQARRLDQYRRLAAYLRRRYRTVILAKIDYAKLAAEEPLPEDGDELGKLMRAQRRLASPGRLQSCLKNSFAVVREVDPAQITLRCHACGEPSNTPDPLALQHTCSNCQAQYDQDRNACLNLFRVASEPAQSEPQPEVSEV